jgi:hypothetical protein
VDAASSAEVTAETVKNNPTTLKYAQAIGINRALKLARVVLSSLLSIGVAPFVGVPSTRNDYKMVLFIYIASMMETSVEDYME